MELLDNAIESVQVGVEDYRSGTRPRLLSAVRNIHAGILLLYKEALRRQSPAGSNDALMMARIAPRKDSSGKIVFVGEGKKTADTQQIRERFDALGIKTDWKRFDRINETRNEVEHLYPRLDQKGLEGLISDSFLVIRDFIASELHDDPLNLLGEETWQAMLEVAEVYQKEKEESRRLLTEAKWGFSAIREGVLDLTCPLCSGDLLRPVENSYNEIMLQCNSCGEGQSPEFYVPKALASALSGEAYIAMTDGGDPPVVCCPECGEDAFLTDEWQCALCGAEPEGKCARCGTAIPVEELDSSPLCGYCSYISNKDD
jgi:ribosomal protein L37E